MRVARVCIMCLCIHVSSVCTCEYARIYACVYACLHVYLFFLSLTMKYLTLSILFISRREGIPMGGDCIGYTYTL